MDYTTLTKVKAAMKATQTTDDALLATFITAASRAIDRKATMVSDPCAVDYFQLGGKTERLRGQADMNGAVWVYVHKPIITGVTAFQFRENPISAWQSVAVDRIGYGGLEARAYPVSTTLRSKPVEVDITYTGGFATDASGLPADLVEVATLLAIRFYKEAESGLGDAVGVAELATMIYTKSWPVRALDMLNPFIRRVGWDYMA